ncbi:hypothetical protein GCM10009780_79490 [Actinomadura alba]
MLSALNEVTQPELLCVVHRQSVNLVRRQGLLTSHRRPNGYRDYSEDAARQVAFIQDLYSAGLPLRNYPGDPSLRRIDTPQGRLHRTLVADLVQLGELLVGERESRAGDVLAQVRNR